MPLIRVMEHFQITIPSEIREKMQIKRGDFLEVYINGQEIVLRPKTIIDREEEERIEEEIAEGIQDYQEGRIIGPFKSVTEFKKALRK
ncbi:MAG: AbrB/MazE/SpoVT family DNA-binding domain-containing protein [Nitrospirae bacterium]|nr:AbrB/MazE/SpoVT family DNA-binding domain-containing protein [Nitrospirota bacterium]